MSREGSEAEEAEDDLKPLPGAAPAAEGGGEEPPPPSSGQDEHSIRVAAKRMSFRQSKKQRKQVQIAGLCCLQSLA